MPSKEIKAIGEAEVVGEVDEEVLIGEEAEVLESVIPATRGGLVDSSLEVVRWEGLLRRSDD